GLRSRELVQQTIDGMGPIKLLADGSYLPIEPAGGRRFYTPLPDLGDGSSALKGSAPLGFGLNRLGIVMLDRESITEILHAFDPEWTPEKG
ncbi:MAG TPA: hypothetical protein VF172_01045, partial [Nitrososphaera sp.]